MPKRLGHCDLPETEGEKNDSGAHVPGLGDKEDDGTLRSVTARQNSGCLPTIYDLQVILVKGIIRPSLLLRH